jgi:hypothetical protein
MVGRKGGQAIFQGGQLAQSAAKPEFRAIPTRVKTNLLDSISLQVRMYATCLPTQ